MTSQFDDDVNFEHLKQELNSAVKADIVYNQRNDAKFRAVNQKVATYEEFRNIVEASHLNPLDKKDKVGGIDNQKWNSSCKNISSEDFSKSVKNPGLIYNPTGYQQFLQSWKICKSNQEKFSYLKTVNNSSLKKCFQLECPMSEILACLSQVEVDENCDQILFILDVVTKMKRFTLEKNFLGKEELNSLKTLFAELLSCVKNNVEEETQKVQSLFLN